MKLFYFPIATKLGTGMSSLSLDFMDFSAWNSCWKAYPKHAKNVLHEDKIRGELTKSIMKRSPMFMTNDELSLLMQWKLKRGKWRPRLQKFVDDLTADQVLKATTLAGEALEKGDFKDALKCCTALRGVGPATASAILSLMNPDLPFMEDTALNAVADRIGKRAYTEVHYWRYAKILQEQAGALNAEESDNNQHVWKANHIQICLWVFEQNKKQGTKRLRG